MNKKTWILAMLIGAIFFTAVLFPPVLSRFQEKRLLGQIHVEPLTKVTTIAANPLDTASRISLIFRYSQQGAAVAKTDHAFQSEPAFPTEDILSAALFQVAALQDLGVFPPVEFSSTPQCTSSTLSTYMDLSEPAQSVQVWTLDFTCEDLTFSLLMDGETNLIYRFYICSAGALPFMDCDKAADFFGEYLGIQWSETWNEKTKNASSVTFLYVEADGRFSLQFFQENNFFGVFLAQTTLSEKMQP